MKKQNRGFTLIELLAVIGILAVIIAIAFPIIGNIINSSKEKTFALNEEYMAKAAQTYVVLHPELLPNEVGESTNIALQTLVDNNAIKPIKDVEDKTECDGNSYVKITKTSENEYTYEPCLICSNYASAIYNANAVVDSTPGVLAGAGTSEDPYLIESMEDLAALSTNVAGGNLYTDKYLKLMYDLDMDDDNSYADGSKDEEHTTATGWVPIGNDTNRFAGNFNGNNKTITNLYINDATLDRAGLFGITSGATITNLSLVDINITANTHVGGLVGYALTPTISLCSATGKLNTNEFGGGLVGRSTNGTIEKAYTDVHIALSGRYVGGLVGYNSYTDVSNAYSTGDVVGGCTTTCHIGGLIGYTEYADISNVMSFGSVIGNLERVGGVLGQNYTGTLTNAFAMGHIDGSGTYANSIVGRDQGTSSNIYKNAEQLVIDGTTLGVTTVSYSTFGTEAWFNNTLALSDTVWDMSNIEAGYLPSIIGLDDDIQFDRYGAMNELIEITKIEDLLLVNSDMYGNYRLMNNLDFNSDDSYRDPTSTEYGDINGDGTTDTIKVEMTTGKGFSPLGLGSIFRGNFDGNNKTISNLYINRPATNFVGFISRPNKANIYNIGLLNSNVTGNERVGSLIGERYYGYVTDSYAVGGSVSGTANYVGGLIGVGGDGQKEATILKNCYTNISVSGVSYIGGITGFSEEDIYNVYTLGNITSTTERSGGIVGQNYYGIIRYALSKSDITGVNVSGGIIGRNQSDLDYVLYLGDLIGTGSYRGAVYGYLTSPGTSNYFYKYDSIYLQDLDYSATDVTSALLSTEAWYTGVLNFSTNSWDFSGVTSGFLPKLKSLDGILLDGQTDVTID